MVSCEPDIPGRYARGREELLGKKIADTCNMALVDMDEYLEQQEGSTVAELFKLFGEAAFREKERRALVTILSSTHNTVIACGGGTPCYFDNMQLMLRTGKVVYLKASVATLLEHLKHEVHLRPMLAEKVDVESFLCQLSEQRATIYEQAHFILDAGTASIDNFTKILNDV